MSAILDPAGNLYGRAGGGKLGYGIIFRLTPPSTSGGSWIEAPIYNFGQSATDGALPFPGLVFDSTGRLYGATLEGGLNSPPGNGTVFRLTPPTSGGVWTESILHAFTGGSDGDAPEFGPIFGASGNLLGTTWAGFGTVFELTPSGTLTTLHTFDYYTDGGSPSGLVHDAKGNLYGTTGGGGSGNAGTVFMVTP